MANEAVCIETPTKFARYTVLDANDIPYGTILRISGDNIAAATSADGQPFAGIAWEVKTADDGITEITAALDGVWDILTGVAGVTRGGVCSIASANVIKQATEAEMVTGTVVGKILETASASEVVRTRVGGIV